MRQPKRLAHRQAEQNRARAQERWSWEEIEDDLDEVAAGKGGPQIQTGCTDPARLDGDWQPPLGISSAAGSGRPLRRSESV